MSVHPDTGSHEVVTDHERLFFDAYGYVILPGLFAGDIDEITEAFQQVFDEPANPRLDINIVGHRFHSHYAMGNFVELHPRLTAMTSDPRLVSAARALLGPAATYVNSDGSIYCCETEWHFDTPTSMPARRHAKFTLYLDPLDRETGAPRVLPISHHHPELYEGPLSPYLGFDGAIEQRTGLPGEDLPSWTLPTRPGDALVWDFCLMHAAYGSTAPRRQIALNFCEAPPPADPGAAPRPGAPTNAAGQG
jgi:Phytanoyl-CoA dioxygenase (PhyH)